MSCSLSMSVEAARSPVESLKRPFRTYRAFQSFANFWNWTFVTMPTGYMQSSSSCEHTVFTLCTHSVDTVYLHRGSLLTSMLSGCAFLFFVHISPLKKGFSFLRRRRRRRQRRHVAFVARVRALTCPDRYRWSCPGRQTQRCGARPWGCRRCRWWWRGRISRAGHGPPPLPQTSSLLVSENREILTLWLSSHISVSEAKNLTLRPHICFWGPISDFLAIYLFLMLYIRLSSHISVSETLYLTFHSDICFWGHISDSLATYCNCFWGHTVYLALQPHICFWGHISDSAATYLFLRPYIWLNIHIYVSEALYLTLQPHICFWGPISDSRATYLFLRLYIWLSIYLL